jgi:UDP-N-acetylmuramate dehydrogenase
MGSGSSTGALAKAVADRVDVLVVLVKSNVSLASLTTLRLGGPAARLCTATRDGEIEEALADASRRGEPALVLGGGSNVVFADEGFSGTVVRVATGGVDVVGGDADAVVVDVAAGEAWDAFVARCVDEGWSGVEALSGIPGLAGATPIQNVGAYGQEIGDVLVHVRALDRHASRTSRTGSVRPASPAGPASSECARLVMARSECDLRYRHSKLKGSDRWVVLGVRLRLARGAARGAGPVPGRYAELARALGIAENGTAPAARVRETVLALRRGKGMVLDAADPETVSAGSFFTNPVLDADELRGFEARVVAQGIAGPVPRFAQGDGRTTLSAAWLVERAGFSRGYAMGSVGVSRRHALALVNRGGATTRELLTLARHVRDGVAARFGVTLSPEPVLVGCSM